MSSKSSLRRSDNIPEDCWEDCNHSKGLNKLTNISILFLSVTRCLKLANEPTVSQFFREPKLDGLFNGNL